MSGHSVDHYASKEKADKNLLARDPRTVIILIGVIFVFTFLIGSTVGLFLLLVYTVALSLLSGASYRGLLRNARNIGGFVLLIIAINAYLVDGTPFARPFSAFSKEGLSAGFYYSMRVAVLYFVMFLFLSVTSQESTAQGLSALVRPFSQQWSRRVALYGFLSIGFLPLFGEEVKRIRTAQGFRGGGFGGGLVQKLNAVRMLIVPLLISAIHRSGQLAMSVELRNIRATIGQILSVDKPGYRDFVFGGTTLMVLLVAYLV